MGKGFKNDNECDWMQVNEHEECGSRGEVKSIREEMKQWEEDEKWLEYCEMEGGVKMDYNECKQLRKMDCNEREKFFAQKREQCASPPPRAPRNPYV